MVLRPLWCEAVPLFRTKTAIYAMHDRVLLEDTQLVACFENQTLAPRGATVALRTNHLTRG